MKYTYDIKDFDWDAKARTFTANAADLWLPDCHHRFPNGRKQFFIENEKTTGFRRFRLLTESTDTYHFISEDKVRINCIIKKEVHA
jgi:hypothetical protein